MLKRVLVVCLVLGLASVANADAVLDISLSPSANGALGAGMYDPGETVTFEVSATQDTQAEIGLRLAAMDFSDSDPALTFVGDFVWDFSTLMGDFLYAKYLDYPTVNVVNSSVTHPTNFILLLPASGGGSLSYGTGQVTLPMAMGTYDLDALNADSTNDNTTARIDYDFVTPTTWLANTMPPQITGSVARMTVVPEPASLALLALGGLAVLRRRRA